MATKIPDEAFEANVLDPVKHYAIIRAIDPIADRAGIDPSHIWTPARDKLTDVELGYLQNVRRVYRDSGCLGMWYTGHSAPEERFSIMVGALIRNRVDARVTTISTLLDQLADGALPAAEVLFVPNFFRKTEFGSFDQKKASFIGELITQRSLIGAQMVVYVDDRARARSLLGETTIDGLLDRMIAGGQE